jgi:5,10-methylenetetrahydrofolate reductase
MLRQTAAAILPGMVPPRESPLVRALASAAPLVSVELRPPRAELDAAAGRDAWIDTYHGVKGLVRGNTFVFLTDSAVGAREEHNLRHLVINLGADVRRDHVVPFLTTKHTMAFCLAYAERAWHEGFPALVVLGGDRSVGPPRCVAHAWELREAIRAHVPDLSLGGWANPHADAATQVSYLADEHFTGEFFLTQVVSHHDEAAVTQFLEESARRNVQLPGAFGIFFYRSANPKTLTTLRQFLPVPAEGLTRDFESGASAEAICARTIRTLRAAGARHFYVSNLPVGRARQTLERILAEV